MATSLEPSAMVVDYGDRASDIAAALDLTHSAPPAMHTGYGHCRDEWPFAVVGWHEILRIASCWTTG
jgi:hypothetical protein